MPKLFLVDAFTAKPFRGNPAAVVILDGPADERWMQSVATEVNQPVTAFLIAAGDAFGLRWFTPIAELDLCGHATLAAAHAVWEIGAVAEGRPALFHTFDGLLTCVRDGEDIAMDFPADPIEAADLPDPILDALGLDDAPGVWKGKIGWVIELDAPGDVTRLKPNFAALGAIDARGFVVCAQGGPEGVDFTSRFFSSSGGMREDAVTGTAHSALGPLWALRTGRNEVVGYQASRRGGIVRVKVNGDRVSLIGRAVTVSSGDLLV